MNINKQMLKKLYKEAVEEKLFAERNFYNADKNFIDVAIFQYNAAISKVDVLLKQIKSEGEENDEKISSQ